MDERMTTIDVSVIHETELAYLIQGPVGEPAWIPKSQIEVYDDGTATLPERVAIEKEVI